MNKTWLLVLLLLVIPIVTAIDFNTTISAEDQQTFDQMLAPVMKVYNFVKYSATVLAILFIVFAAVNLILFSKDQAQREQTKSTIMYIVVGLIIIWIAPYLINYLVK